MLPDEYLYNLGLGISLVINIILGVLIFFIYRERKQIHQMLHDVNLSISEKSRALSEQAAKLEEAYENLWKINQRLDEEGLLRSDQVTVQHRKLVEYIHHYTNKLRGTLASMAGLLELAQDQEMNNELGKLMELMKTCTRTLDEIVRDFSKQIENL